MSNADGKTVLRCLTLIIFLSHHAPMIATLGEAHDLGRSRPVYCRWGKRDGMKTRRECNARAVEVDRETP